jgi:hypothetical protein
MILGMTYLYAGDPETGLKVVKGLMHDIALRLRHPFDLPNMIHCDGTSWRSGTDYYQDMMLWAVPAAVLGEDLGQLCAPGGFVDGIIRAASRRM